MKKANLRLMGFLCPRIKHRIQNTIGFYQWFLISLIVNLFVSCQALAQEVKVQQMPLAATVSTNDFKENSTSFKIDGVSPQKQDTSFQEKITPLKIGDKIPEELWDLPLQVVNHPEGKEIVTLRENKDKLIILDFWATWCSSCIATMPQVHELQKIFENDVIVIPVSKETESKITGFLKNNKVLKRLNISSVVGENELETYFPHKWLPHIVWIGKDDSILATTSSNEITEENIKSALKNNLQDLTKIDIDYNLPLFSHPALQNTNTLIYSVFLRGYQPGLPVGTVFRKTEDGQIYGLAIYNATIGTIYSRLYRLLGKKVSKNDIVISESDASSIWFDTELSNDRNWRENNLYTYELILPKGKADLLFKRMIEELDRYSGYYSQINNGKIELFKIKTPK